MNAAEQEVQRKKHETHVILEDHSIYVAWRPEYETGVTIIDEQHRGIVAAMNSLYYATQHGMGGSMLPHIVGMVTESPSIHFRTEEALHAKSGYPAEKTHRALHANLTRETTLKGRHCVEEKDPQAFLHFMKDWWVHHICDADMEFKDYLLKMVK